MEVTLIGRGAKASIVTLASGAPWHVSARIRSVTWSASPVVVYWRTPALGEVRNWSVLPPEAAASAIARMAASLLGVRLIDSPSKTTGAGT